MTSYEEAILENARKLDKLEKDFLAFTYEAKRPSGEDDVTGFLAEALRIATEAFQVRNQIVADFHEVKELRIYDKNAIRILDQIRQDDRFYSISFYEALIAKINVNIDNYFDKYEVSVSDFLESKSDDLFSDFHSWFSVTGYYYDKMQIGPMITSLKVPDHVLVYFDELRETFAFGQYRSSVALCRALLEMSLYMKLKAKGAFKNRDTKVTSIDVAKEDNLNRYINMAKWEKVLDSESCGVAHEVRTAANSVLHLRDSSKQFDRKETMKIILDTVRVVEMLYR